MGARRPAAGRSRTDRIVLFKGGRNGAIASRMERKNWAVEGCPIARSVDLIGEWGSLMILREAFSGVTRFDDFQRRLGISRSLLSTRLKKLVGGGVLDHRPVSADAKRHEYVLTAMGEDLITTVVALRQWGDRWLFAPDTQPADMVDAIDGAHVATIEVLSEVGRPLRRLDIRLIPIKKRRRSPRRVV